MDSHSVVIIVIVALIAFLVFYIIGIYNKLVNSKNIVNDKWQEIDKQLKRKTEIVPKLIEVVKGYANQEETLFMILLTNRNSITHAISINDKIDANNELNVNLTKLLELEKSHSKLKKDDKYKKLVAELKTIDDKIDYAKEFYNEAAIKHNERIQKFPVNVVAKSFNFKTYELFKQ